MFSQNRSLTGAIFVLRLNRTLCSPVTQVYHAQIAGAVGVVFIPDYLGPLHYLHLQGDDPSSISIPSMQLDPYVGKVDNAPNLYFYFLWIIFHSTPFFQGRRSLTISSKSKTSV
jgi:hypothetical protein